MPSMETPSNIEALMLRGFSSSDTLKLLTNVTNNGVYVLHGGADQTVPIAQARFMRTRLAAFHPNFAYLEPSHVAIRQNIETRTFVGNTSNVARLAIDVSHLAAGQPVDVTLDSQALNWLNASKDTHKLWFERQGNDWAAAEAPEPRVKRP